MISNPFVRSFITTACIVTGALLALAAFVGLIWAIDTTVGIKGTMVLGVIIAFGIVWMIVHEGQS